MKMEQEVIRFLDKMESEYGKIAERPSLENYLYSYISGDIVATKSISRDNFVEKLKEAAGSEDYEPSKYLIDEAVSRFENSNGPKYFREFLDSESYAIECACKRALKECAFKLKVIHTYSEDTVHEDVIYESDVKNFSPFIKCQLLAFEDRDKRYEIKGNTLLIEREIWNEVSGVVLGKKTVSYTIYDTEGNEVSYDWNTVLSERRAA